MTKLFFIFLTLLAPATHAVESGEIYKIPLQTIDAKHATLADYKGKTLLIVNTASQCGYTPQYEGLEKVYAKYKDRGLIVLAFPSNDFGGQEPGSNGEIKKFCQTRFHVTFPMFAKAPVTGQTKQDLYKYLTSQIAGEVKWTFEKFLVATDGRVVARFGSSDKPGGDALTAGIEKNLPPLSK